MANWRLAQGCGDSWTVPIVDGDNNPIPFVGTETLAGSVWPGGQRAALKVLAPTWLVPSGGTTTVAINDTLVTIGGVPVNLPPATYSVRCTVDAGSGPREYYEGRLRIVAGPGTTAAPVSYINDDDLRDFAAWIDELQAETDQAGFANQCGRARAWLDGILLARWQVKGSVRPGDPGYGAWSLYGSDFQGPSKWLRDQLVADRLMVSEMTREIVAKRALYLICKAQLGRNGDHSYQDLARGFLFEAEELVKTYRAEIDLNDDGFADVFINCGATSLR